jgi:peptide/nickel transport system permease protein
MRDDKSIARAKKILKKLGQLLLTLFAMTSFNFILFRVLPGDPVKLIARSGRLGPEAVARLRVMFGLDKSIFSQYFIYLKNIITGEFGISVVYRRPVADVISARLSNTLVLLAAATVLVIVIGIGAGIIAAMRRGSRLDRVLVTVSMIGWSLPTFWTGLLLIIVFGVFLRAFPIAGILTPGLRHATQWDVVKDFASHLVLPTLALAIVDAAQFFLVTRSALTDVLTEDYVQTARAKGLSRRKTLFRHAMPNAMLPVVTAMALYVSLVIGGAIQIETVFSYPGMGMLMYDAVLKRDYPILEASFFLLAAVTIMANFLSDILYMAIDPRVDAL